MSQSIPSLAMDWLRQPEHAPIPAAWVPGASEAELSALNALGGITRHLLAGTELTKDVPLIQEWFENAPEPPEDVLNEVVALTSGDGDAVLARLYSELVTSENRRQLGTFFTPVVEAEYMIALWNDTYGVPGSVVDVGAGVGVFTASAATAWPDADIIAVDVNPVTLGLLGARLAAPEDGEEHARIDRASLVLDDYTTWVAGDGYASLAGPRLILGNPPYTRASLLSAPERKRFQTATDGICGLRASLSTIITAISLKYLRAEDGLCLLLPAQWLESDYARGLRERLWALKRPVDLRLVAASLFDDAQVDAVVLMVGPEQKTPQAFAVRSWKAPKGRDLDREGPVPQNWRQLFPTAGEWIPDEEEESFCLQDVAVVRRGVATGANSFFVLTESRRKDAGLSKAFLVPMVKRLANLPDDLDDRPEVGADVTWMLSATIADRASDTLLDTYISQGVKDGLAERHLCAKRKVWYELGPELLRPDVIVGAMSRSIFRVVANGPRAAITNNLFGWTWNSTLDDEQRESLVRWLRGADGQSRLRRTARRGGDGLLKLEPRALRTMRIPRSVVE